MQTRKSFPTLQFLVYNAEIFFVNSYNPRALVVKRTKFNSKKSEKWDTLVAILYKYSKEIYLLDLIYLQ